jgi:hypothetical protein
MCAAPSLQPHGAPDWGQTLVLPGQTPAGEEILAVLLKRTYDIVPGGPCRRAGSDSPLIPGDRYWGNPLNTCVRYESDFVPFKVATDLVFDAKVHAPGGVPTPSCTAAVKVAGVRKDLRIFGDRSVRYVKDGLPQFTDPKPFETMELRWELAYGGIDVYSDRSTSWPYPPNPRGRGFLVANTKDGIENLALPNIEDPKDLLAPSRLCIGDYAAWGRQPAPAGLSWYPKTALPRAGLAGILPADRATERELRQAYGQLVPAEHRSAYLTHGLPDMDFRYFSGASPGLALPYLTGDEEIGTANLSPEGILYFRLPGESPRVGLDIGEGPKTPETVLHTVLLRMEDRQLDLVWRGAVPYPGRDWLPNMRKMAVSVQ